MDPQFLKGSWTENQVDFVVRLNSGYLYELPTWGNTSVVLFNGTEQEIVFPSQEITILNIF